MATREADNYLNLLKNMQKKANSFFSTFSDFSNLYSSPTGMSAEELEEVRNQYFAYMIYMHKHDAILKAVLGFRYMKAWKDLDKFIQPISNPLRKVANIKAKTYERPPIRRAKNVELQKIFTNNAKRINAKLDYACKLLNATGNVCIWPVFMTKKDETLGGLVPAVLDLIVVPAHKTFIIPNYTDNKFDIICQYEDYYLISILDESSFIRENFITKASRRLPKYNVKFVEIGNPVWVGFQGCGFEKIRTVDHVRDLINGTIDVGIMEAMASKVTYLKSFKQMVQTDEERIKVDQLEASPNTIWPANIDTIDLADKDFGFENYIETKAISLAGNHGVSKIIYKGDFQSSDVWSSISEELLHHWEEQVELWHGVELELWENLQKMSLLYDGSDYYEKVSIRFQSPFPSMRDPRTEWELHREKVKHGIESTIERMMMEHPDILTEEEAYVKWKENLEQYAQEVNLYRSLNISLYGNDPATNGALGYIEKQKMYGEIGKEGPQVGGSEFQKTIIEEANNE